MVLGQAYPDSLTHMNCLALTYQSQGRIDAAIALLPQITSFQSGILGEDHQDPKHLVVILMEYSGELESAARLDIL
jgi:hypothetical protein